MSRKRAVRLTHLKVRHERALRLAEPLGVLIHVLRYPARQKPRRLSACLCEITPPGLNPKERELTVSSTAPTVPRDRTPLMHTRSTARAANSLPPAHNKSTKKNPPFSLSRLAHGTGARATYVAQLCRERDVQSPQNREHGAHVRPDIQNHRCRRPQGDRECPSHVPHDLRRLRRRRCRRCCRGIRVANTSAATGKRSSVRSIRLVCFL